MHENELLVELAKLVEELAFDYDRLSKSGQQTYTEICSIVNALQGG